MAPQRVYSEFSRSNYKAEQPLEQTLRGEKKKKKTHNIYKDVYGYIAFLHVLFIFKQLLRDGNKIILIISSLTPFPHNTMVFLLFFLINQSVNYFLAVLGLHCDTWVFSSFRE